MPVSKNARIYVADHEGFFGAAILQKLKKSGYKNLILATRKQLDLSNQRATEQFFKKAKPEYVYLSAQLSGSIAANVQRPAEFLYKNLMIEANAIHAASQVGVKKLLFFGASCVYPKETPQPIKESYLWSGSFEKTSESYSIAKIAGIGMAQSYAAQYGMRCISIVPATIYGPGASFDPVDSHVLTGFIRRFHDAKIRGDKEVVVWGTGKPRREFLYIEDLADACLFLMENYDSPDLMNIGTGEDVAIKDLAGMVKAAVGFKGRLVFDTTKPDGAMRKLLDSSKAKKLGWKPNVGLENGIRKTYRWFLENKAKTK